MLRGLLNQTLGSTAVNGSLAVPHGVSTAAPTVFTFVSQERWIQGFTASVIVVLLSELGDDTFWIVAVLAARKPWLPVFLGAAIAMTLVTALSVGLGMLFPALLSPVIVLAIAASLWTFYGMRILLRLYCRRARAPPVLVSDRASSDDDDSEMDEASEKINRHEALNAEQENIGTEQFPTGSCCWASLLSSTVFETFSLTFFGDWGDPSQVATTTLAATHNPVGVLLGGALGHLTAASIAILFGRLVMRRLPRRWQKLVTGVIFLAFGVVAFARLSSSAAYLTPSS